MKKGELIDITDERDLLNTSESYSCDYFLFNDKLIMPVINLDVIDQSVLGNKTRIRIEFAYLILTDIGEISWIGEKNNKEIIGQLALKNLEASLTDWFANHKNDESYELKVKYHSLLIYIPTVSKSGQDWWAPWDTPNFAQNIEQESLDDFTNLDMLPDSLYEKLEIDRDSKQRLEFTSGTKKQIASIKGSWSK